MVNIVVALLLMFALGAWIYSLGPITAPVSAFGVLGALKRHDPGIARGRYPGGISSLNRIRGPTMTRQPNPILARKPLRLPYLRARARPGTRRKWAEAEWVMVP